MKKLMLTVAGLVLLSTLMVDAQSRDTVATRKRDNMHKQQGTEHQKRQNPQGTKYDKNKRSQGMHGQGSANLRERRKITVTEVPASVRQTLRGPEYKGWDDQTTMLYRKKAGDRYTVEFHDGNKVKVYHFDSSGNRIDPK